MVALETLRLEVLGLQAAYPEISQPQIAARFEINPQTHGSNAFNLVVRRDWDDLLSIHRQLRLIDLVAIYEGWIHSAADELALSQSVTKKLDNFLQAGAPEKSLADVLGRDVSVARELKAACRGHVNNRLARVATLRRCYRAFKEARNAIAHTGNVASARTRDAWNEYDRLRGRWKGISRSAPELPPVTIGAPVTLTTAGVIGFANVVQMMMITFDAEIAGKQQALDAIKRRWVVRFGRRTMLSADRAKAHGTFANRWRNLGLPPVGDIVPCFAEFRESGLVF